LVLEHHKGDYRASRSRERGLPRRQFGAGRVGDKWSVLIIVLLGEGPKRFNAIKRMVGGIFARMLTSRSEDWNATAW